MADKLPWTLFIPPQLDLLGPGSRVTVEAAPGDGHRDALASYRAGPSQWARVAEMRARSPDEQRDGHYWELVWCEPAFANVVRAELEYMISPAQVTEDVAHPYPAQKKDASPARRARFRP